MTQPIRTILAAVADLEPPFDVMPQAIQLAERTGATLHLVHAFDLPDSAWDIYARIGYPDATALRRHAETLCVKMEERVRTLANRDRIHCHATSGSPQAVVAAYARKVRPDVVIIGATRHGRIGQAILGTTAQRVLRASPVPVLVLRGTLAERPPRILMTTDLSPFSEEIHERGLDTVDALFGEVGELRSVLVVPFGTELPPPLNSERLREAAEREVHRFLSERRPRAAPCQGVVRLGDPASGIITECRAWKPDILVLGTHGRHGAERWVLGSVAEATLRAAGVNVLVVPAAHPPAGERAEVHDSSDDFLETDKSTFG
jgi:nucleotide-binding universal stress UspA family protein